MPKWYILEQPALNPINTFPLPTSHVYQILCPLNRSHTYNSPFLFISHACCHPSLTLPGWPSTMSLSQAFSGTWSIPHEANLNLFVWLQEDLFYPTSVPPPQNTWGSSSSEQYWICVFSKALAQPSLLYGISCAFFCLESPHHLLLLQAQLRGGLLCKVLLVFLRRTYTVFLMFLWHWSQIPVLAHWCHCKCLGAEGSILMSYLTLTAWYMVDTQSCLLNRRMVEWILDHVRPILSVQVGKEIAGKVRTKIRASSFPFHKCLEDVFRLPRNIDFRTFKPTKSVLVCVLSFKIDPSVFYFLVAQMSGLPGRFADLKWCRTGMGQVN